MKEPVFSWQGGELIKEGKKILSIPEFELNKGEVRGLMGPNGAGKSSLLRIVGLLEKVSRGQLFFQGRLVDYRHNLLPFRRKIAFIFQEQLFVRGTVYDNIVLPLRYRKENSEKIAKKARFWLKKMGLEDLQDRSIRKISGGEAQRTAIARALVAEPELLLLDEPMTGLDNRIRRELLSDLKTIIRETGLTVLFVSHDYDELNYLCSTVTAMVGGRIVQTSSPELIALKPQARKIAQLIVPNNLLAGEVVGKSSEDIIVRLKNSGQLVRVRASASHYTLQDRVSVYFRPEHLLVQKPLHYPDEHLNSFAGRLDAFINRGGHWELTVECGDRLICFLNNQALLNSLVGKGDNINLYLPAERIHIIAETAD